MASKSVGSLCCAERRRTCSFCYGELNISSATLVYPTPMLSFWITLRPWWPCHEAQLLCHWLLDFMRRHLFSQAQTPSWLLPPVWFTFKDVVKKLWIGMHLLHWLFSSFFSCFCLRQCLTITQAGLKLLNLFLPQSPQMNTTISGFNLFFLSFFFPPMNLALV